MLASAPGKTRDQYEPYVAVCWWDGGLVHEDNAIETLQSQIVTCHIHDNNGLGDQHSLPGRGNINWKELMPKLLSAPRLVSCQSEVAFIRDLIPVKELVSTMERLVYGTWE
jgi:hypothetical protein